MLALSGLLVLAGVVLLVGGLAEARLALVWASVAASSLAGAAVAVAVMRQRGGPPPAGGDRRDTSAPDL